MNIPGMAQSVPGILLIARETLKPRAEAEYDRIESETRDPGGEAWRSSS